MAIQLRRGTIAQWDSNKSNIVVGEPAVATDTEELFIGTGSGTYFEVANADTIADEYNTTSSYSVGDVVRYQGKLYKCNTATSGAWVAANWDETTVNSLIDNSIGDGEITTAKLADSAVTTAKINNGAVTTAKLADSSVTPAKLNGVIDSTLATSGKAADAKATGDEIADLKQDLEGLSGVPTNVRQAMLTLFEASAYAETGLTDEIAIVESWATAVTSLTLSASTLSVVQPSTGTLTATVVPSTASVTWSSSDETIATVNGGVVTGVSNGSCVITASAGDKSATCTVTVSGFAELVSISAVYTQSGTVYDTDSLDSLKSDLVVTATYSDSSTATVTTYTLSGTLTAGTSTITVSYGGKTDTFTVTVTHDSSTLPTGYTKYDYLYSNANAQASGSYIPTITFTNPTTAKVKVVFQEESGNSSSFGYIFGQRQKNTGSTNNIGWGVNLETTNHLQLSNWSGTPGVQVNLPTAYEKYEATATWTASELTLAKGNDTPSSNSQTTRAIGGYPLCLFGIKHATSSGFGTGNGYPFRGKIYYAEAEENGTIVMQCYPCVRDSDSQVGMYDVINETFYTPYSTSGRSVTVGNDA